MTEREERRLEDIPYEELVERLGEPGLTILDVRSRAEFDGVRGAPCDPRQGHVPGAVNLDVQELTTLRADQLHERLGPAEATRIVADCHSGSRSALAVQILRAAGYDARNYPGSWHEWSRLRAD